MTKHTSRAGRPNIVQRLLSDKSNLAADLVDPGLLELHRGLVEQMSKNSLAPVPSDADVEVLRKKWLLSLQVAEDYAVSERIQPLLDAAAKDLPDDYVVEHHHLHAEHGFIWYERKIYDEVMGASIRVLTWHSGTGYSERTGRVEPGLEVNVWAEGRDTRTGGHVLIPVGADFVPWGMMSAGWRQTVDTDFAGRMSNALRQVIAFQTFCRMELPAMTSWPIPKAQRKPLSRLGLPPEREVTVIDLRARKSSPAHDERYGSDRVISVRHVVRGHWHAYWVGTSHPLHSKTIDEKERVHIYVHPFLRGPEDGPLAMTQRVHVVRR